MSILCDGDVITSAIDDVGENVTVRAPSITGYNEWGDSTETTTDTTVKVFVTQLSGDEQDVKEGKFAAGDLRVFFKSASSAYAVLGNRIYHDSKWYEIKSVLDAYSTYYVEVLASRI